MILSLFPSQDSWQSYNESITRLYVLRHGEVAAEWRTVLYGQMDVPLSDFGKRQSEATGRFLANIPLNAVYSSDLDRARFLGESIAAQQGLKPQLSVHLRERKFGDWQGKPWSEVEAGDAVGLRHYLADRFNVRAPGDSENFPDVCGRVLPFVKELLHRHRGQRIALTAHSGPARIILAAAMNMPLSSLFTFDQDYCCLNVIDIHDDGNVRVKHLNLTSHLDSLYNANGEKKKG